VVKKQILARTGVDESKAFVRQSLDRTLWHGACFLKAVFTAALEKFAGGR
jgi:hypothetical protein